MNYKTYDDFIDTLKRSYQIETKDIMLADHSICNKIICKNKEYEVLEYVYKYKQDVVIYYEKLYFNKENKLKCEYKLITCISLNLLDILG